MCEDRARYQPVIALDPGQHTGTAESCDAGEDPAAVPADGRALNTPSCDSDCTPPLCGDGVYNPAADNTALPGSATEECDTAGFSMTCNNNCTLDECGDGIHNPVTEQCDDANSQDLDGCRNSCVLPRCGDGVVSNMGGGEVCEDTSSTGTDNGCDAAFPHCRNCQECTL